MLLIAAWDNKLRDQVAHSLEESACVLLRPRLFDVSAALLLSPEQLIARGSKSVHTESLRDFGKHATGFEHDVTDGIHNWNQEEVARNSFSSTLTGVDTDPCHQVRGYFSADTGNTRAQTV